MDRRSINRKSRAHIVERRPLPGHVQERLVPYAPQGVLRWFGRQRTRGMGALLAYLYDQQRAHRPLGEAELAAWRRRVEEGSREDLEALYQRLYEELLFGERLEAYYRGAYLLMLRELRRSPSEEGLRLLEGFVPLEAARALARLAFALGRGEEEAARRAAREALEAL